MTDNARTASSVILGAFRENSDRIAIRRSSSFPEMTYGELLECACRVAAFLEDKGIESGKGNRVAICMGRNPGYVVSFIGCLIFGYAAAVIFRMLCFAGASGCVKGSSNDGAVLQES